MPGPTFSYVNLMITFQDWCYYSQSADEETEAKRGWAITHGSITIGSRGRIPAESRRGVNHISSLLQHTQSWQNPRISLVSSSRPHPPLSKASVFPQTHPLLLASTITKYLHFLHTMICYNVNVCSPREQQTSVSNSPRLVRLKGHFVVISHSFPQFGEPWVVSSVILIL